MKTIPIPLKTNESDELHDVVSKIDRDLESSLYKSIPSYNGSLTIFGNNHIDLWSNVDFIMMDESNCIQDFLWDSL